MFDSSALDARVSGPTPAWARRSAARPTTPVGLETFENAIASGNQQWLAALLCAVAALGSLLLMPIASEPIIAIPGFLAINQSALALVYGLMTGLFFTQYRRSRSISLLALGAGSLYTTLIVLAQLVCFPDMLRPGLVMGQGPATLTWLWNFWHVAPPLFALSYALLERDGRQRRTRPARARLAAWSTIVAVTAAALLTTVVVTRFVSALPVTVDADGGYRALTSSGIGPALIALTALALAVLCWTTRLRSVLQLWLAVSLVLLLLDNVVTDLGAARATVGWFFGRLEALLAGLVIIGVYLWELDSLRHRAERAAVAQAEARSEAQSARENLEIALDASGMGDWELDLQSGQARRTLRHDRIFGYETLQPGWSLERFLAHVLPEDRAAVDKAFADALRGGKLDLECRIQRAGDQATRWISVQGRTYLGSGDQPTTMAGCLLDVTERRQTDERLRRAERMESIGQLTGGVAHDFNNLLTVILGNLDMIIQEPGDRERTETLAKRAFRAGRRGTDLTDKLLAFSRRQIVQPQTVNLNRLAAELQPLLKQAAGEAVEIELDLDPQLDPASLDHSQFQAALLNLAGNARDAMPRGGLLRLATRNVSIAPGEIASLPEATPGAYLRVTLSDTGVGMDPTTKARAFEPFFTTKEVGRGTGLGLSQVYGFVRQAGGFTRIETAPGQGCKIELYLPRSSETPADPKATEARVPLRPAVDNEVVLVVEDEEGVREVAAESLRTLGYGVLTAPDARVALDILRGPNRVDVMFSDVVMPGGMNGAQLAFEARKIRSGIKVLLTSGFTATATGGARELPADVPLLRKPYLQEDLARHLRSALAA